MNVIQVFPGFITGGLSYTVPMMCRAMISAGADVLLRFCGPCEEQLEDIYYRHSYANWPRYHTCICICYDNQCGKNRI